MTEAEFKELEEFAKEISAKALNNIDWQKIRDKVHESPEMKKLDEEVEYLRVIDSIFKGNDDIKFLT